MKVFISQPMGGLTDEEIQLNREKAIDEVKHLLGKDVSILDTNLDIDEDNPVVLLGMSLIILAKADIAYFYRGWKNARGCKIEHDVCNAYGIKCIET